jgi:esterase/lipase superfamily enzyme|tara:strand:- start:9 stop:152 length:144 start_codon:yes stop_codon:yes gene_type:complete
MKRHRRQLRFTKAGIIMAIGYEERYLDIINKTKELLKNRRIGFFMGY